MYQLGSRLSSLKRLLITFVTLLLFSSTATAFAASQYCSGNGYSVRCHRYFFGYTKCNIYDRNGYLVSEFVDPDTACQSIQ